MDVLRATAHHFDFFLAGGFGLILTGWMLPWISELKLPVAKYREGPRTLYALQDLFITLQVVPRDSIGKLKLRKIHSELYNAIIVTRNSGCLRFRAIPSKAKAESLLQALTSESQVAK
jgi:hypothetical protein